MLDLQRLLTAPDFSEPLRVPAVSNLLALLLTGERDEKGARILTELPRKDERQMLRVRLAKLDASLYPGRPDQVAAVVGRMMLGFSSSRHDDPEAVAARYIEVLAPLPLWAIAKTCMRFGRGGISKSESPDWKKSFPPSTAQLYQSAQSLVAVFWKEAAEIRAVLEGVVVPKRTAAEQATIAKGLAELLETTRARTKAEQAAAIERHFQATSRKATGLKPVGAAVSPALAKALAERDELDAILGGRPAERAADHD